MNDAQQGASASASGGDGAKANRLRKACDLCSQRKVKCDESGPPCRACAALDVQCTFERPSRRRGPPNKHAEAAKKRQRLDSPNRPSSLSSPTSPSNVAATLASFSAQAIVSGFNAPAGAESIGIPLSILQLLVEDFFTYIHPLAPFPHEPSFRCSFRDREDLRNPSFLALLASMVGVLAASFPRKPRLHLKAQGLEKLFPSSISLVSRCHKVAVEARGPGYLDKELTVYDAVTSYFLGLAAAYTFQWRQARIYFGETLTIARVVGVHRQQDQGFVLGSVPAAFGAAPRAFEPQPQPVDYIKQEVGRRIFWIMLVGIRSMQQMGANFAELMIPPPTRSDKYPPLPMEVDDEFIFHDHVMKQPEGLVSKLKGFNLGCQIYSTVTPLATLELAYGIDEIFDWNRQKRVLEECLRSVKKVLDNAPPELRLQPGSKPGEFDHSQYYPPVTEYSDLRTNGSGLTDWPQGTPEAAIARRQLQYEIQKANIYASQLGTRSYIVEKYWNLQEAFEQREAGSADGSTLNSPGLMASGLDGIIPKTSPTSNYDGIETNIADEREDVVKDLLHVLRSISQINMEPNGGSFINKIRQIASTLLDTPHNRKGPLAVKAEEYLGRFLDILMRLERIGPEACSEDGDLAAGEEEELRNWADIREYQMKFAQSGGFWFER